MIKPYLNSIIHIKNLSTYRDFLKKRPTKAQQVKLSMIRNQSRFDTVTENGVQLKLLKALRIAKPVSKVDLQECKIIDPNFWEPKLLAACKTISKVKTFCLTNPKGDSEIKHFKYFPKLKNLRFQLHGNAFPLAEDSLDETDAQIPNYLKTLKYCPKIRSLDFTDSEDYSPKIKVESSPYMRSLDSLILRGSGWKEDQFEFPLESCQNVKSVSLQFPYLDSWKSLPQILNIFLSLPNLQEVDFSSIGYWIFDSLDAFKKIAKKGILKKIKLELGYQEISKIEKILTALKPCKLTNFSLKAQPKEERLKPFYRFIQRMDKLESLHLDISNRTFCTKDDDLRGLCKQISKLQALRNLALIFSTLTKVSKDQRISNFIPELMNTFTKPIKIESLHLECNQLDPSDALQSLLSVSENSAAFLSHLRVDFGDLPCTNKTYRLILKLMKNLSNIQVLGIPCLALSGVTSCFLDNIIETIYGLKYLRMFEIGEIKDTVDPLYFYDAVEAISSKRGLRQFDCHLSYEFQKKCRKETSIWDLDMDGILEKNPFLESFVLTKNFHRLRLGIYKWTENSFISRSCQIHH